MSRSGFSFLDGRADLNGIRGVREARRLPDTEALELELEPFTGVLEATFEGPEGGAQGAYYVYVERL